MGRGRVKSLCCLLECCAHPTHPPNHPTRIGEKCKMEIQDNAGFTAIWSAVLHEHEDCVRTLVVGLILSVTFLRGPDPFVLGYTA